MDDIYIFRDFGTTSDQDLKKRYLAPKMTIIGKKCIKEFCCHSPIVSDRRSDGRVMSM